MFFFMIVLKKNCMLLCYIFFCILFSLLPLTTFCGYFLHLPSKLLMIQKKHCRMKSYIPWKFPPFPILFYVIGVSMACKLQCFFDLCSLGIKVGVANFMHVSAILFLCFRKDVWLLTLYLLLLEYWIDQKLTSNQCSCKVIQLY